jgi:hypothetical protein
MKRRVKESTVEWTTCPAGRHFWVRLSCGDCCRCNWCGRTVFVAGLDVCDVVYDSTNEAPSNE